MSWNTTVISNVKRDCSASVCICGRYTVALTEFQKQNPHICKTNCWVLKITGTKQVDVRFVLRKAAGQAEGVYFYQHKYHSITVLYVAENKM